jgi:hypothetical protein
MTPGLPAPVSVIASECLPLNATTVEFAMAPGPKSSAQPSVEPSSKSDIKRVGDDVPPTAVVVVGELVVVVLAVDVLDPRLFGRLRCSRDFTPTRLGTDTRLAASSLRVGRRGRGVTLLASVGLDVVADGAAFLRCACVEEPVRETVPTDLPARRVWATTRRAIRGGPAVATWTNPTTAGVTFGAGARSTPEESARSSTAQLPTAAAAADVTAASTVSVVRARLRPGRVGALPAGG